MSEDFQRMVRQRLVARDGRDDRRALCQSFPVPWSDVMWGLDADLGATADGRALLRAGGVVCSACPIRLECLAAAIVRKDRHGLSGGLGWTLRTDVARIARSEGVLAADKDGVGRRRQFASLLVWLSAHPEVMDRIRVVEAERRRERRHRKRGATAVQHRAFGRRQACRRLPGDVPLFE